jgi:hypothetical protein
MKTTTTHRKNNVRLSSNKCYRALIFRKTLYVLTTGVTSLQKEGGSALKSEITSVHAKKKNKTKNPLCYLLHIHSNINMTCSFYICSYVYTLFRPPLPSSHSPHPPPLAYVLDLKKNSDREKGIIAIK